MNRLLHYNIENTEHTRANYARISGWDIVGKTGTTDNDTDCWFCGMSPYAVMATWTGFDSPAHINDTTRSAKFFATVMGEYLKDKEQKEYNLSPNVIAATYNPVTGLVISTDYVSGKYVGYYTEDNMPAFGSAWKLRAARYSRPGTIRSRGSRDPRELAALTARSTTSRQLTTKGWYE